LRQEKDNPPENGSREQRRDDLPEPHEHTIEITGLGIIASFMMAAWPFVSDGTLRLSDYLVFVALLLVSAGALVWRLVRLAPHRTH
jgi:hypothetical protein